MGGVGLLVRAELRRRWLALVLIGLLAGAVGAAVVTSVAGARRSETAYDRLAELTGQPDATLISLVGPNLVEESLASPEVEAAWPFRSSIGQVLDVPAVLYLSVVSGDERPRACSPPGTRPGARRPTTPPTRCRSTTASPPRPIWRWATACGWRSSPRRS